MEKKNKNPIKPEEFERLDEAEEQYFTSQFVADGAVLEKLMSQKEHPEWEDLGDYGKGALTRLAAFSARALRRRLLEEKDVNFLVDIGAGKVPKKGSKERKEFDNYLNDTGLV